MGEFDYLIPKAGGQGAGAPPPTGVTPPQGTIATPPPTQPSLGGWGGPGTPIPGVATGPKRAPGLYTDGNGIVWRIHPDGRQTYGTQAEQKQYGKGQGGGSGTTVVLAPPAPTDPNATQASGGEYSIGRSGDSEIVWNPTLKTAFILNRKTRDRKQIDPKDLPPNLRTLVEGQIVGGQVLPEVAQAGEVAAVKSILDYNQKKMETYAGKLANLDNTRASMERLKYYNEQGLYSGPGADLYTPFMEALVSAGVITDDAVKQKLYNSRNFTALIKELTPKLREMGSGSSSDADIRLFESALPRITNLAEANTMMINGAMQMTAHMRAIHEARERYFNARPGATLIIPGQTNPDGTPKTFTKSKDYGLGNLTGFEDYQKAAGLNSIWKRPKSVADANLIPDGEIYIGQVPVTYIDPQTKQEKIKYGKNGEMLLRDEFMVGTYRGE